MGQKDYRFDIFLMDRWADPDKTDIEERRKSARRNLQKALKESDVAAPGTIRAWCDSEKRTQPGRDKMYQLAFALHLTHTELEEYLKEGLGMPGVQVNDYREMIYYYGLEHQLPVEACDEMILVFEKHMCREFVPLQETHTNRLWKCYESWRRLDRVHFLKEMCHHAEMFKGYSKTTLNYFLQLKSELTRFIQKDVQVNMRRDLKTLEYEAWLAKEGIREGEQKEVILRFLKNVGRRGEVRTNPAKKEMIRSIRRDVSILYAQRERNRDILRELYASVMEWGAGKNILYKKRPDFQKRYGLYYMSESHISDLLSVSLQKEREIQLSQKLAQLEEGEEKQRLEKEYALQKKRCLLIQREDLLPLLMEVSRRKYQEEKEKLGEKGSWQEAREKFRIMADTVLADCSMTALDPKYALDRLLLDSFQENDVWSFADLIDEKSR